MLNMSDIHCHSVMFIRLKIEDNIYAQQKRIGQINNDIIMVWAFLLVFTLL